MLRLLSSTFLFEKDVLIFFLFYLAPVSTSNCSATVWASNATTIAGSPIGVSGSTSTALHSPHDVWVANDDSIYVLDSLNYRVQLYHPGATSGITVINSTYGAGLSQFSNSKQCSMIDI
jgi:hypothetical protein